MGSTPIKLIFAPDISGGIAYVNVVNYMVTKGAITGGVEAAQILKKEIVKSYLQATTDSKPNTIWTRAFKTFNRGLFSVPTLYESGSLLRSLMEGESDVRFSNNTIQAKYSFKPPEAGQDVAFPEFGQVRKNPNYIYLYTQEFGTRTPVHAFGLYENKMVKIPKRPFLRRGAQSGVRKALAVMQRQMLTNLRVLKLKYDKARWFEINIESEFEITPFDIAMTFAPPSKAYAIMGGAVDIYGFFQGTFTNIQTDRWLMSYAKGKGGATKKVQRRKMRRKLWGL